MYIYLYDEICRTTDDIMHVDGTAVDRITSVSLYQQKRNKKKKKKHKYSGAIFFAFSR